MNPLLYYNSKESLQAYSIPPGTLSISRFINGQPCWMKEGGVEWRKKTLIICGFALECYTPYEIRKAKEILGKLLQGGFTIYHWEGEPSLLDLDRLEPNTFSLERNYDPKEKIVQAMGLKGISQDEISFLDHTACLELFFNEKDSINSYHLAKRSDRLKAIEHVHHLAPNLIQLIGMSDSGFNNDEIQRYYNKKLKEKLQYVESVGKTESLNFFGDYSNEQLLQVKHFECSHHSFLFKLLPLTPNLCSLKIHIKNSKSFPFALLNLKHLEFFDYSYVALHNDILEYILLNAPNLKEIKFQGSKIEKDLKVLENPSLNLSSLEILDCSYSTITLKQLIKLLEKTPNISILDISNCQQLYDYFTDTSFEFVHLYNLKILKCSRSSICAKSLGKLLQKTPHLKELYASYCNSFDSSFEETLNLNHLEIIKFCGSTITSTFLKELLKSAIKLRNLELANCRSLEDIDLNAPSFPDLVHFNCRSSSISARMVIQIIRHAPHIQGFGFEGCNLTCSSISLDGPSFDRAEHLMCDHILNDLWVELLIRSPELMRICNSYNNHTYLKPHQYAQLTLDKLRYFSLNHTSLPFEGLIQILSKAPHVETLSFQYSTFDESNKISCSLDLNYLKEFTADKSLTTHQLLFLLSKTSQLERLTIANGDLWGIARYSLNLSHLKELNLRTSTITGEDLAIILSKTPLLKELNLSGFEKKIHIQPSHFKDISLFLLEKLYCYYSEIDSELLGQILLKAPNIKVIDITGCSNVLNVPQLPICFKELVSFNCNRSSIQPTFLKELLNRSPKLKQVFANKCPNLTLNFRRAIQQEFNLDMYGLLDSQEMEAPTRAYRSVRVASRLVDPNTTPFEGKLTVTQVFMGQDGRHPHMRECRMEIFDSLRFTQGKDPFKFFNEKPLELHPCHRIETMESSEKLKTHFETLKKEGHKFYLGIVTIDPETDFRPLESLCFNEKILTTFVNRGGLHFFYNEDSHQYYLQNLTQSPIKFHYILQIPDPLPLKNVIDDEKILDLIKQCSEGWTDELLSIQSSPEKYLEAIISKKRGSCTHRTVAFKELMKKYDPTIPVRAVFNQCHTFPELCYKGQWLKCDLGGTDAEIEVKNENNFNLAPRHIHLGDKAKTSFSEHLKKHVVESGKNSLIEVHSDEELHSFLNSLKLSYSNVIYFPNPTPLEAQKGVVVVNLSSFDSVDIANFLNRKHLSEQVALIGVYILNDSFVEKSEFNAFFQNRMEILPFKSSSLEQKILEVMTRVTTNVTKRCTLDELDEIVIPGKNIHIALHSEEELEFFIFWAHQKLKNIYFIDKPEDIRCSSKWLDHKGILRSGPGGMLYDYLTQNQNPVLLLNYSTFEPDDIAGTNSIIDVEGREADGVLLPPHSCVIGLSVISPKTYKGKDFTDRFYQRIEITPFTPKNPLRFSTPTSEPIDLYGIEDWKEQLLGTWILQSNRFIRKPGLIEGKNTVHIKNGPWNKREFRLLWLNRDITIEKSEHVDLSDPFTYISAIPEGVKPICINPSLFGQLEVNYHLENGSLSTLPGLIEKAAGGNLYGYMTRALTDSQKYRLQTLCKKHHVTLHVALPQGTIESDIVITNDIDGTVDRLSENRDVFDITDCDTSLLYSMDVRWNNETEFEFINIEGALQQRENVILKGHFSEEMIDHLIPLLLEKKMTLVTDTNQGFELFKCSYENPEKIVLKRNIPKLPHVSLPLHPFEHKRLNQILYALNHDFHVYIEGETGVGKTTFVREVLQKIPQFAIYVDIIAWAKHNTNQVPILFVDEVNLQHSGFSLFEGLYHKKPGILYKGAYYPLTQKHRVIFAGNPNSYGGERREVLFLKRHPNRVLFTPLSTEFLKEVVLKPYQLPSHIDDALIEAYRKKADLTPRELEMMALLTKATRNYQNAIYYITKEGKIPFITDDKMGNFILTDSRKEIHCLMNDLFAVRKLRQKTHLLGGLGGIVLEGAPRDGKTHFAIATLKEAGFKQVATHEIETCDSDAFCILPTKMETEEKRQRLLAAFHAGQVILCNEINTNPQLESLFNALLMGFDEKGNRAKKPGFFLIATQNPIFMAGRRAASKAMQRRMITYEFSPYSPKETFQIIHERFPDIKREMIRLLTQNSLSFGEILHIVEKAIQSPKKIITSLPEPLEQKGPTCKLCALSMVITWLSQKNSPTVKSIRSLAKQKGFTKVGEIYSPSSLVSLACEYGFNKTVVIDASKNYAETLKEHIDRGDAPLVFFDVDTSNGKPIKAHSEFEHSAVCMGYFYNLENELFFTLLHWGKPWVVSAKDLSESAGNLSIDRPPETFYKVKGSWRQLNDRSDRQNHDLGNAIASRKFTKKVISNKSNDTFRNKLIVLS